VSLSVFKDVPYTHHRVASLRSLLCALVESLLDRRDILIGDIVSFSSVLELAAEIRLTPFFCILVTITNGLNITNNSGVLTSAT